MLENVQYKNIVITILFLVGFLFLVSSTNLNCSITASGSCAYTPVLYLENDSGGFMNAHAQNVSVGDYNYVVCCDAEEISDTVTTSCGYNFLKLSSVDNAHVEQSSLSNYSVPVCIDISSGDVTCSYADSCDASQTCLLSMASSYGYNNTNAHVSSCDDYTTKVCCSLNSIPIVTNVRLTSTSGNNLTSDDLTLTFEDSDADGDSITNITDWRINGTSIAVLNMPFNHNNSAGEGKTKDYSTFSNNGTLNGGVKWTSDGKIGGAYEFDENDEYINIGDLGIGSNTNASISLWAKFNAQASEDGNYQTFIRDSSGFQFYQHNANNYIYLQGADYFIPGTLNNNEWYNFILTWAGNTSTAKLYVNNVEKSVIIQTGQTTMSELTDTTISTSGLDSFNGSLDEVLIFNRSLTQEQIQEIYQAGLENHSLHKIDSLETDIGETWSVAVTPNDGSQDGETVLSNNLTIQTLPLDECGVLSEADKVYHLTGDVTSEGTCFNITAENVTIDCHWNKIQFSNSSVGYGVYSNQPYTTIKNCFINQTDITLKNVAGVWLSYSDNSTIYDNLIYTGPRIVEYSWYNYGVTLRNCNNVNISKNNISTGAGYSYPIYPRDSLNTIIEDNAIYSYGPGSDGIYHYESDYSTINRNNINVDQYVSDGIYFYYSDYNNLSDNLIDVGSSNPYAQYGVYLHHSKENNFFRNNFTTPYMPAFFVHGISGVDYNNTIGEDNLENSKPIKYYLDEDDSVFENTDFSSYGQLIFADSNNLTLRNITTFGDGLNLYYVTNSLIEDSNLSADSSWGMYSYSSSQNNYTNNNIDSSALGYSSKFYSCDDNNIERNIFNNIVWFHGSCDRNIMKNNSHYGYIRFDSNDDNYIENAFINDSGGYGFYLLTSSNNRNVINNSYIEAGSGIYYRPTSTSDLSIYNTKIVGTSYDIYSYLADSSCEFNMTNVTLNSNSFYWNGVVASKLNKKWYLDVYTNDHSNNSLANATILSYDNTGELSVSTTTRDTDGFSRQELIEYWRNSSSSYEFNNYTINATHLSYDDVPSITFNMSENKEHNFTFANSLPTVTLVTPEDNNITTNRTPVFTWNGYDADNDTLTYEINITCWPGCSSDNRYLTDLTEETYTVASELKYLSDNGFHYNWSVRAHDGSQYGNWATQRRLDLQALLTINLVNASVDFGNMNRSDSDDTTDNIPYPLKLRNDGNSYLNVTVNVSSLFETDPSPTENYKIKVENSTSNVFDLLYSIIDWINAPTETTMAIVRFNYSDLSDTAEIDLSVAVPSDETPGNKTSTLVFTSRLAE